MAKKGNWGTWAIIESEHFNYYDDFYSYYDKYAVMIADQMTKKSYEKNNIVRHVHKNGKHSLIDDIKICNFIKIWERKGEDEKCLCGGTLNFFDHVTVRYHKGNGEMVSVKVPGKKCMDCSRKFVVKEVLLKEISKHAM